MRRILVVDDEKNIRRAVGMVLESEGFTVDFASNGEEALTKVGELKPDLVLLDMFMPKLSGKRTCELMRAERKFKGVKVIFLTVALPTDNGMSELESLRISDYITKPFDNEDLIDRVKRALAE